MSTLHPDKVGPIDGETIFRLAFKRNPGKNRIEILGKFNPTSEEARPGTGIGCLTLVAIKTEEDAIVIGTAVFRNTKKDEPYQRQAGLEIARIRLLKGIMNGPPENLTPVIHVGSGDKLPILTELPERVLDIMSKRRPTNLFSAPPAA